MRKILAILLALTMVVGLGVSAWAGSITITRDATYDGSTGRTYTAYRVFDSDTSLSGSNTQADKQPTYTEDGPIAYTMALDNPWLAAMQADEQIWFNVELAADGSCYVVTPKTQYTAVTEPAVADIGTYYELVEGEYVLTEDTELDNSKTYYTASEISDSDAVAIAAYLNENIPSNIKSEEFDPKYAYDITPGTAADVADGYYLIVASDGATNLTLVTTDVTIVEKNTYITTGKTTSETSYNVGDIVTYTATVSVPADASLTDPIILHDTMSEVLSFKEDVAATMDGAEFKGFSTSYGEGGTAPTDGCTFEITIPVTNEVLGKTITFTYTAEVTSAAADPDTGFVNTLFGEKNGYSTTPSAPQVYTFDFDFVKVFDDEEDEDLTATFELRTTADDASTAIAFITDDDGNYVKADSDDENADTTITMTNGNQLNFAGFKAGTYYLVEISTSTGYNLLDGPVTIIIEDTTDYKYQEATEYDPSVTYYTKDGDNYTEATVADEAAFEAGTYYTKDTNPTISHTVTYSYNGEESTGVVTVENHSGTVLPSTGGIGTTIFYIVGGLLAVGAGVVLITKKRMGKEDV